MSGFVVNVMLVPGLPGEVLGDMACFHVGASDQRLVQLHHQGKLRIEAPGPEVHNRNRNGLLVEK